MARQTRTRIPSEVTSVKNVATGEVKTMGQTREQGLVTFLNTLPDIDDYRYEEEGKHHITNEWLCGIFAGRGFVGDTPEDAVRQLIEYLDRHIEHKSMVGASVTESGWPDLEKVKNYLISEFYSEDE